MRGVFAVNKYYTDNGVEYAAARLQSEFAKRGHTLDVAPCPTLMYDEKCNRSLLGGFDFVIFWNKDCIAASELERTGVRVFNSAQAIENCDDKAKTISILAGHDVAVPKTVFAPHVYDVNNESDWVFIDQVENYLGYPIVIKENKGSQGRQVYLAQTRSELSAMHKALLHTPHIFQQYVSDERGVDIRVYVVGGKAVAWCKRRNTTGFKSNVHMGGRAEKFDAPDELLREAERIADLLKLDFGSVDFLTGPTHIFAEANSNAYFFAIEKLGFDVAGAYADYVIKTLSEERDAK